ncbi:MAG: 50S ribosomal protein L29 [Candidatus Micrarchaeota archaeon]|nr:50S ribosomal protein L29 [Candidatus Micrarchaeota archaeon]MDE1823834.1 50S ribosomal protein L29 [Candidatus Micrarchaeota archaeon]MDE1849476.1 50S ribosomal protein L29 [Candidatus Micrarchaeota archaeon]
MRIKDLRSLSNEALIAKLGELRLETGIEKRRIASTGVASKKIKTREMRRTVAQILTILREKGAKA